MSVGTSGAAARSIAAEITGQLQTGLRGQLIRPADADYDLVRQVWNGMVDKRPALIARCAGVADVVAAVRFGHEHRLPIAVRGGGHNVAGAGVCDGGLVIDLSQMNGIRVDPQRGTVRAEGGVTIGELDHETQAFGLAVPMGVVTATGIAGLTLGGGLGWLRRRHGLSCDNLISADLVTADGHLVTADEQHTRSCCGPCGAVVETSAWSPPSSTGHTRSGRRCTWHSSSIQARMRTRPCTTTATGRLRRRTR
ncbi:FAD-binding oxidoreductase [Pseudonocardia charpentierae]|uniref:FAD-dependent oxidoreductase n=1 Tax=Pseudonocardia charpentierae TaxID=3075545 RepID=A0ABU2NGW9_9PSEU|nr:FAD-dependent oxidoreductase [Pseudonocardia sp. DSM 45834]MDT0352827.1 FAD-dependent oxidoreductase [Pseudonocardia sp. DSM 45834]